jgi:hypothetical protein
LSATLPDKVEHINGNIADNRWINLDVNNEKQQETNWRNKMKKENKKEKVREFKFVMNIKLCYFIHFYFSFRLLIEPEIRAQIPVTEITKLKP